MSMTMRVVFLAVSVSVLAIAIGQTAAEEVDLEAAVRKIGVFIRHLYPGFSEEFLLKFLKLAKSVLSVSGAVSSPSGSRGLDLADLQSKVLKLKNRLVHFGPYVQKLTGLDTPKKLETPKKLH
uniref:Ribosomal RNA small subunit methyltransferase G n=1 Tax=Lygus hesperus TaxID=30085 RepID=A0A0A9ZEL1_LYGHE